MRKSLGALTVMFALALCAGHARAEKPRTLKACVEAGGFDRADPIESDEATDLSRYTTEGVMVFRFRIPMTSAQVVEAMAAEGYAPATVEHLLAYAAAHPYEPQEAFLIALGTTYVKGDATSVPMVYGHVGRRILVLQPQDRFAENAQGAPLYRFLAVRKKGAVIRPTTFEAMVAAGHYDWVSINAVEDPFQVQAARFATRGVKAFRFEKRMTTAEVVAAMAKEGYVPAPAEALLAYGVFSPDVQRTACIVALGSTVPMPSGADKVLMLDGDGTRRELIGFFDDHVYHWHEGTIFLGIRKTRR